jgi:uncharacterized protein YndB with AHSA1/START domain
VTIAAEFETPIARTADAVFRELTAVERFPEWLVDSGIVTVERLDGGELEEGSRLRIEQRIRDRAAILDAVVTVLEPGGRLVIRAFDPEGISVELEAQVAGDGATCRLRWSIRLGLPLRYRFFESMVAPQVRRAAAHDLDRLRRRLEAVAG